MTEETTQKADIKIIRLNTGEDVIAQCLMDDETSTVLLGNPMKVYIRRMEDLGQTMLVMMPWLPLEIVEEDLAEVNYADIITMVNPKSSFIDYYFNTVESYQAILEKREQDITMEDPFEEDEMDDETVLEMLETIKEKRNKVIH
jgi:hypothetical protein